MTNNIDPNKVTGGIRALQRRGRHTITLEEARALQARARLRGQRIGQRRAQVKANTVPAQAAMRQLLAKWARKGEPFVVRSESYYYAVTEIPGRNRREEKRALHTAVRAASTRSRRPTGAS